MWGLVIKHISKMKEPKQAEYFFGEMFTKTEQILYMKRFAILVMLERGYSFGVIKKALKVSQTTISLIQKARKLGKFNHTVSYLKTSPRQKQNSGSDFIDFLGVVLQAGLPPRGKGRWQHVWKKFDEAERKKSERRERRMQRKRKS